MPTRRHCVLVQVRVSCQRSDSESPPIHTYSPPTQPPAPPVHQPVPLISSTMSSSSQTLTGSSATARSLSRPETATLSQEIQGGGSNGDESSGSSEEASDSEAEEIAELARKHAALLKKKQNLEDAEAARVRDERLAAYKAKKDLKPKVAAKSIVTLDVKPWGMLRPFLSFAPEQSMLTSLPHR